MSKHVVGVDNQVLDERAIKELVGAMWTFAVKINPIALATIRDDYKFDRLADMVRDCLARGLSLSETKKHVQNELLKTLVDGTQPGDKCHPVGSTQG